jgi:hypothetical protein
MPLSEHEQRILDEIERRLAAEDPKFARTANASTPRGHAVTRMRRSVVGFALGLIVLIGGLLAGLDNANVLIGVGLAGFGVMLFSIMMLVRAWRDLGPVSVSKPAAPTWFRNAEERWRKRFERGDQ